MANILKDGVPTYVRNLIEKEFKSNSVEEKSLPQNRAFTKEADREIKHPGQCPRHMAPSEGQGQGDRRESGQESDSGSKRQGGRQNRKIARTDRKDQKNGREVTTDARG